MATYAIGDVQGCFKELMSLLESINYDQRKDKLWFVGDLVNRGPDSLKVLRFVKEINAGVVLGNHDLHLLVQHDTGDTRYTAPSDTLEQVLLAPDVDKLLRWLRHQPLLAYLPQHATLLVHAGILPNWTQEQALAYAEEAHQALTSENYQYYLKGLYGNTPSQWDESLTGLDRFRTIINVLTRMRAIDRKTHALNLSYSGDVENCPKEDIAWFQAPSNIQEKIVFGHWSALNGVTHIPDRIAIDTGCVWGGKLTAYELEFSSGFSYAQA